MAQICTDRKACNYQHNGSCNYGCYGCTDKNAINYDDWASKSCDGNYGGECGNVMGTNCCCQYKVCGLSYYHNYY